MARGKKKLSYLLFVFGFILTVFLSSKLSLENWFYNEKTNSEKDDLEEAAKNKALLFAPKILRVSYDDGRNIILVGEKINIDNESLMHVKDFILEMISPNTNKFTIESKNGIYDNKNSILTINENAILKNGKAELLADGLLVDIKNKKSSSQKKCTYKDEDVQVTADLGFFVEEKKNYDFFLKGGVQFIGLNGEKAVFESRDITGQFDKKANKLIYMSSKNKSKMVGKDYVATSDESEVIGGSSMILIMKNNLVINSKDGDLEAEKLEYNFDTGKTKIFSSAKKRLKVKVYEK